MRQKMTVIGFIALCSITMALVCVTGAQAKTQPKITMAQATKKALQVHPGRIKSSELEREKGRLIYSFDIVTSDGIHEVNIDAMSGKVVEDSKESAADEEREAAKEQRSQIKPPQHTKANTN